MWPRTVELITVERVLRPRTVELTTVQRVVRPRTIELTTDQRVVWPRTVGLTTVERVIVPQTVELITLRDVQLYFLVPRRVRQTNKIFSVEKARRARVIFRLCALSLIDLN